MLAYLCVNAVCVVLVLLMCYLSYKGKMLLPGQMKSGVQGLPLEHHYGVMWGDVFIIPVVVGHLVDAHALTWSHVQWGSVAGVGLLLSAAMHWVYTKNPLPDALAWKGAGITPAGWVHFVYMWGALTVIGLGLFCSALSADERFYISLALTVHVLIGNHVPLGLLNLYFKWPWCPEFLKKPDPWVTTIAAALLLLGAAWWQEGLAFILDGLPQLKRACNCR